MTATENNYVFNIEQKIQYLMADNAAKLIKINDLETKLTDAHHRIAMFDDSLLVATQALRSAGFTPCDGPARWKPPVGQPAGPTLAQLDQTREQALALALASVDLCSALLPHRFTPENADLRERLLKVLNLSLTVMGQQP